MSVDVEEVWRQILGDLVEGPGIERRQIAPSAPCDLFLGVEKSSERYCLLLEVDAQSVPDDTRYPGSRGFEVIPSTITSGPRGRVRILLAIRDTRYTDIFPILVSDVLEITTAETNAEGCVRAFLERLFHWQSFLERYGPGGLNDTEQQGLYGELLFMRDILLPSLTPPRAVESWGGPAGTNQDFQVASVGLEVKTTSSNPHQKIHISNVRQLDSTGCGQLFLTHFALDVRAGETGTLPELVDEIRDQLDSDDVALDEFNRKLNMAGYLDIHLDRYRRTKYTLRFVRHYIVIDDFPRILEGDLRNGVGDVKYSISVPACSRFVIEEEAVLTAIGGEKHERGE